MSEYTIKDVRHALLNEELEYLKRVHSADPERFKTTLKTLNAYAAMSNHKSKDTSEWLYDVVGYRPEDSTASTMAMFNGNIELARWMYSKFFPFDERTFRAAVYRCGLDVLKWLLSVECPRDETVFAAAAERGDLEMMMWMRKKGFVWDERACESAAKKGKFKELMWLRDNGCPWDDMTAFACLRAGNVEMLRWAIEHGCPHNLDALIVDSASFGTSEEMRKFLHGKKKSRVSELHKEEINKGFQHLESMFEDMTDVLNNWFSENAFSLLPALSMEKEEEEEIEEDVKEEDDEKEEEEEEEFIERDGVIIPMGYFSACIWPEKLKELIDNESGYDDESGAVDGGTLSKYFRWKYITMREHRKTSDRIFENHITSEAHAVSHCTGGEGFEAIVKKSFDLIRDGGGSGDDEDEEEEWDRTKFPAIGHYRFVENEGCCDDVSMVLAQDVTIERMIIPHPVTSLFKKEK